LGGRSHLLHNSPSLEVWGDQKGRLNPIFFEGFKSKTEMSSSSSLISNPLNYNNWYCTGAATSRGEIRDLNGFQLHQGSLFEIQCMKSGFYRIEYCLHRDSMVQGLLSMLAISQSLFNVKVMMKALCMVRYSELGAAALESHESVKSIEYFTAQRTRSRNNFSINYPPVI
jgi:hypothetical protein